MPEEEVEEPPWKERKEEVEAKQGGRAEGLHQVFPPQEQGCQVEFLPSPL